MLSDQSGRWRSTPCIRGLPLLAATGGVLFIHHSRVAGFKYIEISLATLSHAILGDGF